MPIGAGFTQPVTLQTAILEILGTQHFVQMTLPVLLTALSMVPTMKLPMGKSTVTSALFTAYIDHCSYRVTTSDDALTLSFVTQSSQKNIGSRLYLMASETEYQMFTVLGQEFTFDVDVSQLPCGLNGALYFVSMDADGGMAKYPANKAGAKYGTGYCDSQCPRDLKFINGEV